jgi:hypothetical protein
LPRVRKTACQNTLIQLQKLIARLLSFTALSWERKRLLLEALGLMAFVPIGFRLLGVPRTQAVIGRWRSGQSTNSEIALVTIRQARRSLQMVKRATGLDGTCLSRSFALWTMLGRRGIETDLLIGYRKSEGRFEGHAWLEYQGVPINEQPDVIATYTLANGTGKIRWT